MAVNTKMAAIGLLGTLGVSQAFVAAPNQSPSKAGNLRAAAAPVSAGAPPSSTQGLAATVAIGSIAAVCAATIRRRGATACKAAKATGPSGEELAKTIPRPEDLLESPKFPLYTGSTGGYMSRATRERHAITWTSKEAFTFEMPTGGWAIMNKGENLCYFRKKEMCIALGKQLRKMKIDNYKIYRLKKDGTVIFMHPADGVFPEKVNKGRVQVNGRPFTVCQNPQPGQLKWTKYHMKTYEADPLSTMFVQPAMGGSASRNADAEVSKISVEYDQESPSGSCYKSVISQPLDEYIDFDSLVAGVVKLVKDPPKMGLLKASECEELSESEFRIRHEFAVGTVGHLLGFEDFHMTEHTRLDREQGELVSARFDTEDTLVQTTITKIHRDPLRVESWVEIPESRQSGRIVAVGARHALQKAKSLVNSSVEDEGQIQMHGDAESLSGSGLRAAVSDPLDDHFEGLDQLWDGYVKALKLPPDEALKGSQELGLIASLVDVMPKLNINSFEVKEVSPTEFTTITVIDGESLIKGVSWLQRLVTPVDSLLTLRSSGDTTSVCVYVADRSKAEISCQVFDNMGTLTLQTFSRFYEDPLRVEVWAEQAKVRQSGQLHCVVVWTFLSTVIKEFRTGVREAAEAL